MPPQTPPQKPIDPQHMLPPHKKGGVGPTVGIVIIVVLLVFGALYFWGEHLNQSATPDELPFIPGDSVTPQR